MTKKELIEILQADKERLQEQGMPRLVPCGDDWKFHVPGLDWVEPIVRILDDGRVRITEWPHGTLGKSTDRYMTYDEFLA